MKLRVAMLLLTVTAATLTACGPAEARRTPLRPTAPPQPTPAPAGVLMSLTGTGSRDSAPFRTSREMLVKYSYDCSATGSAGNFAADMVHGNQSSMGSDDQLIANVLGTGGANEITIFAEEPGENYYLEVDSGCRWSVTVTGLKSPVAASAFKL